MRYCLWVVNASFHEQSTLIMGLVESQRATRDTLICRFDCTGRDRSCGCAYAFFDIADFEQASDMSSSQAARRPRREIAVNTGARLEEARFASMVARRHYVPPSFDEIRLGLQLPRHSLISAHTTNHLSYLREENRVIGTPFSSCSPDQPDARFFSPEDHIVPFFRQVWHHLLPR